MLDIRGVHAWLVAYNTESDVSDSAIFHKFWLLIGLLNVTLEEGCV